MIELQKEINALQQQLAGDDTVDNESDGLQSDDCFDDDYQYDKDEDSGFDEDFNDISIYERTDVDIILEFCGLEFDSFAEEITIKIWANSSEDDAYKLYLKNLKVNGELCETHVSIGKIENFGSGYFEEKFSKWGKNSYSKVVNLSFSVEVDGITTKVESKTVVLECDTENEKFRIISLNDYESQDKDADEDILYDDEGVNQEEEIINKEKDEIIKQEDYGMISVNKEDVLLKGFSLFSKDPVKNRDALISAVGQLIEINPKQGIRCWEECINTNISEIEKEYGEDKFSYNNPGYVLVKDFEYTFCRASYFENALNVFSMNESLLEKLYTKSPIYQYFSATYAISFLIRKGRLQEADNILSAIYKNESFTGYAEMWKDIINYFEYGDSYRPGAYLSIPLTQPEPIRDFCMGWIERIKNEEEQAGAMTFAMQMF